MMYKGSKFTHMGPRAPSQSSVGGGAGSQTDADSVVRFATAVNSSLSGQTGAVQYSITGIAGLDYTPGGDISIPESDTDAEATDDAEVYAAPGIIGRPLPPRVIDGEEMHMDVVCIETADGLVPFGYRDLRLTMADGGPSEGVLAFVGYGGGFHSMSPVAAGDDPAGGGTIHVVYCPYDFDSNGVPQKAHAFIMDPTAGNESIALMHADGMALTMSDSKLVLKSADGSGFIEVADGAVKIGGDLTVTGGLMVAPTGGPAFPIALVGFAPNTPLVGGPSVLAFSGG